MNMRDKDLDRKYRSPGGLDQWLRDCEFLTNDEGIKALDVNSRTWFRWKANGIPKGWQGDWLIRRMVEIKNRRVGLKSNRQQT